MKEGFYIPSNNINTGSIFKLKSNFKINTHTHTMIKKLLMSIKTLIEKETLR